LRGCRIDKKGKRLGTSSSNTSPPGGKETEKFRLDDLAIVNRKRKEERGGSIISSKPRDLESGEGELTPVPVNSSSWRTKKRPARSLHGKGGEERGSPRIRKEAGEARD